MWITDADWQIRRDAVLRSPLAALVDEADRVLAQTKQLTPESAAALLPGKRGELLYRLQALTVRAAFRSDKIAAAEALRAIESLLSDPRGSDLGRSHAALHAVIAYAFCHEHWIADDRDRLMQSLYRFGLTLQKIGDGNPDNPFNNWWGVTHSASAICFLASLSVQPKARIELARDSERVATYLTNYGDEGHYYEGTGYGLYSFAFWGPLLLACDVSQQVDLARYAPGARKIGMLTHMLSVPMRRDEQFGRRVFWNDDSDAFPDPALAILMGEIAPAADRPAIQGANRRYRDPETEWKLSQRHSHAMWPLLFAPLNDSQLSLSESGKQWPRMLLDNKMGLVAFRNRWRDADDTIFAVYAKAYHGGGHEQQDAGSFRCLSLGEAWASAGGQAKPEARYQNVPLRNDKQHQTDAQLPATGKICYFAEHQRGGQVSIDLGAIYGVPRCRRHFAIEFNPFAQVEALIAIWDEIIEDKAADRSRWGWPLCYSSTLAYQLVEPHAFALRSPTQGTLQAWFGAPSSLRLSDHIGPTSRRTFSEGTRSEYPGSRYVLAENQSDQPSFFTVMMVGQEDLPPVRFEGSGYDRRAIVGETFAIGLDRSRWFQGPLRISPMNSETSAE